KASEVPNAVFFALLAGALAGYGAYQADCSNVPALAPALDWITGHLYLWFPLLPRGLWYAVSGLYVGGIVFLVVGMVWAAIAGPTGSAGLEGQLKGRIK